MFSGVSTRKVHIPVCRSAVLAKHQTPRLTARCLKTRLRSSGGSLGRSVETCQPRPQRGLRASKRTATSADTTAADSSKSCFSACKFACTDVVLQTKPCSQCLQNRQGSAAENSKHAGNFPPFWILTMHRCDLIASIKSDQVGSIP